MLVAVAVASAVVAFVWLALTVAVLVSVPETVGVTANVAVADAPAPRVPRLHVTVPDVSAQLNGFGLGVTNNSLEGSVSVSVTPVAVSGPELVAVSV